MKLLNDQKPKPRSEGGEIDDNKQRKAEKLVTRVVEKGEDSEVVFN